jgi:hypothetical protein
MILILGRVLAEVGPFTPQKSTISGPAALLRDLQHIENPDRDINQRPRMLILILDQC